MTASGQDERRRYQRVNFVRDAVIETAAGNVLCQVLDISLQGLLVEVGESQVPAEDVVDLELSLMGGEPDIRLQARVVHREDGHVGLAWEAIDLESLSRLRRLLELNLGDPELIRREIGQLLEDGAGR